MSMSDPELPVTLMYSQPRWRPEWAVPEVPVPESSLHDQGIEYLRSLLLAWAEREQRNVLVARNLGIRWYESEPRAGFDPDLCVIEPAPPGAVLPSLRLWEPGHEPPWLAIEVVSPGHPYKDYLDTPARAAACGVRELWVYDPLLAGPRSSGGPFALQIWTRHGETMTRTHASSAPGHSPAVDAWLLPEVDPEAAKRRQRGVLDGRQLSPNPAPRLRIMTAEVGGTYWPTLIETERQAADAARRTADAERHAAIAAQQVVETERARADAAEAKLRTLERQLEALRDKS